MDNSDVHAFSGDGFSDDRIENCAWIGICNFVECPAKPQVLEVFAGDSVAKEILGILVLEEIRQPIHRLSFGQEIHDGAGSQQSGRHGSLLLIPLYSVTDRQRLSA